MNTLQVFGIKLVGQENPLSYAPEKKQGEHVRCEVTGVKLITEETALRLAKKAQEVVVPAGTIITPAAADVLKEAQVAVIRR